MDSLKWILCCGALNYFIKGLFSPLSSFQRQTQHEGLKLFQSCRVSALRSAQTVRVCGTEEIRTSASTYQDFHKTC